MALSPWPCVILGDDAHYCILIPALGLRLGFLSAPSDADQELEKVLWMALDQVPFCPIKQAFSAEGKEKSLLLLP